MKGDTTRRVEDTRRDVAGLEVDKETTEKQASVKTGTAVGRMVSLAKDGWSKIKGIIDGNKLVIEKDSGRVLLKEEGRIEGDSEVVMEEWDEGVIGRENEIEEVDEVGSEGHREECRDSGRRGQGFEFLEELQNEEKEEELEKKSQEGRKRKLEMETGNIEKGLIGKPGWKCREKESVESERWKREVGKWETSESGEMCFKSEKEKIPLPENFRLGLDGRGEFLNHRGKAKNNFGLNNMGLFSGGIGGKKETKNWIATFTKSGCIACCNEEGK